MRIKLSQLRRIIREEAEKSIDEMAYAGNLPFKNIMAGDEYGMGKNIERYVSTPTYLKRAQDLFSQVPVDVYILPIAGDELTDAGELLYGGVGGAKRIKRITSDERLKAYLDELANLGYNPEEIADKVKPGSTVIIALHGNFDRNITPAAWNMLHAFFDNRPEQIKTIFGPVADVASEALFGCTFEEVYGGGRLPALQLTDKGIRGNVTWAPFIPFKWARGDYLGQSSGSDLVAECLVATGFRPSGFKLKIPPDVDRDAEIRVGDHVTTFNEAEAKIQSLREPVQEGFSKFVDGKLVIVSVSNAV